MGLYCLRLTSSRMDFWGLVIPKGDWAWCSTLRSDSRIAFAGVSGCIWSIQSMEYIHSIQTGLSGRLIYLGHIFRSSWVHAFNVIEVRRLICIVAKWIAERFSLSAAASSPISSPFRPKVPQTPMQHPKINSKGVKIPFQPAKKMSFSSGFYLLAFLLARFVWFWHTLSLFLKQFPLFVHGLRKIPIKDAENVATDKVITARSCPVNKINNNRFIKGVANGLNGNGNRRQQARIVFTMVILCL